MTQDANETSTTLDLVRDTALELLRNFDRTPSALRIEVAGVSVEANWAQEPVAAVAPAPQTASAVVSPASAAPAAPAEAGDDIREVRAPAVGTFYTAPEPSAQPFVSVGDVVRKGSQIGIVEVMKLMIPVESDVAGTVVELLKKDGDPVEYDEPLLRVTPGP